MDNQNQKFDTIKQRFLKFRIYLQSMQSLNTVLKSVF